MAWEYVVPAVFVLLGICVVLYQRRKRKKAEKVAAGIEIRDENGNLILDNSTFTTRVLGEFCAVAGQSGTINDERLNGNNVWVAIVGRNTDICSPVQPSFVISGNSITWDNTTICDYSYAADCQCIYGVY